MVEDEKIILPENDSEEEIAWTDNGFYHEPKWHHPCICAGCTSDTSKHGKPIQRKKKDETLY